MPIVFLLLPCLSFVGESNIMILDPMLPFKFISDDIHHIAIMPFFQGENLITGVDILKSL
ncbi:MAG TPA: hypothetical protein HPP54_08200 [Nitrospinae bacterium]|nr:hypothetical protein [Nitrospinota bacterium]